MKDYSEMSFDEKVSFHTGDIIVAIGEGKLRQAIYLAFTLITNDAYERGKAAAMKEYFAARRKRKIGRQATKVDGGSAAE